MNKEKHQNNKIFGFWFWFIRNSLQILLTKTANRHSWSTIILNYIISALKTTIQYTRNTISDRHFNSVWPLWPDISIPSVRVVFWASQHFITCTQTHAEEKEQLSCNPFPFTTHTHIHACNYELMRPERKNEGHVQLEMKHKSSTICLFVQTRASRAHTHTDRKEWHMTRAKGLPSYRLNYSSATYDWERETRITTRCFLQGPKEKCCAQINHGLLLILD